MAAEGCTKQHVNVAPVLGERQAQAVCHEVNVFRGDVARPRKHRLAALANGLEHVADEPPALAGKEFVEIGAGIFAPERGHQRSADQAVAKPSPTLDDLDELDIGQQARNVGGIDVGASRHGSLAALRLPIGKDRAENRIGMVVE